MKKLIIAAFIAILAFCSSNASAQNVISVGTQYFDQQNTLIWITYDGNWTGKNGSTNPDLIVDLTIVYQVPFHGVETYYGGCIVSFDYFDSNGHPVFNGGFYHPFTHYIESVTVTSTVPYY